MKELRPGWPSNPPRPPPQASPPRPNSPPIPRHRKPGRAGPDAGSRAPTPSWALDEDAKRLKDRRRHFTVATGQRGKARVEATRTRAIGSRVRRRRGESSVGMRSPKNSKSCRRGGVSAIADRKRATVRFVANNPARQGFARAAWGRIGGDLALSCNECQQPLSTPDFETRAERQRISPYRERSP